MQTKAGVKQNFILLAGSLFFSLILAETAAIFFLPLARQRPLPLLRMQADPACGYKFQPGQRAYTLEAKARINRWGFRGEDWAENKPADVYRIAFLGDSYIFGLGVEDADALPAQFEKIMNEIPDQAFRFETLNFGVNSHDSGRELGVLKNHALRFQPKAVFLCFFINDLVFMPEAGYGNYPVKFAEEEKRFSPIRWKILNIFRRSRVLTALLQFWNTYRMRNVLVPLEPFYVKQQNQPPDGPFEPGWKFSLERLAEFKRLADEHGFEPFFAVIPTPSEIRQKKNAPYVEYLRKKSGELGIPFVDMMPAFKGTRHEDILIPYDYHFNQKGNRLASELVAKEFLRFMKETGRMQV